MFLDLSLHIDEVLILILPLNGGVVQLTYRHLLSPATVGQTPLPQKRLSMWAQTLHTLHKDLRALLAPAADIWKDAFMDWYSKSADHDRPSCTSPQVGRGKRKDWLADADEIKVLSFWYIPSGFLWRPSGDIFLFMDLHFVHRQCRRWVRDWTQDNEYLMLSVISAKCVPKIQKKRRKTDWLVGSICWWNFVFIYNCIYLCTQFIYRSDAS